MFCLHICVYTCISGIRGGQKKCQIPRNWSYHWVVSHYVGAENWTLNCPLKKKQPLLIAEPSLQSYGYTFHGPLQGNKYCSKTLFVWVCLSSLTSQNMSAGMQYHHDHVFYTSGLQQGWYFMDGYGWLFFRKYKDFVLICIKSWNCEEKGIPELIYSSWSLPFKMGKPRPREIN